MKQSEVLQTAFRLTVAALLLLPTLGHAQEARPSYKSLRYEEDWRALCDPTKRTELLDSLKCVRLGDGSTLTLGGELRLRGEAVSNPGFGIRQHHDQVLLYRSLLFGDLHVGDHVRAFAQFGFDDQSGRVGGAGPTDRDRGDLIQGFVDVFGSVAGGQATLRGGRQEIAFGSQRLVSVRDGPNLRRSFDGGRAFWISGDWRIDALYVRPVLLKPGAFDDATNNTESLGGLYLTGPVSGPLKADLYWFDYTRDQARFASGPANERRQSVGARLFGVHAGFDWDIEGVYQWGSFGARDISAWTVASNLGFTFEDAPLAPRIGLKADIASGDRGGRALGTFNALYPKLPYFSEANLLAPANFIDLHPEVSATLTKGLTASLGWNVLWRETVRDAVYASPLNAIPGTAGRGGRYTGNQVIAGLDWKLDAHCTLAAQYVHFTPGSAVRNAGGRTVDFGFASLAWRF